MTRGRIPAQRRARGAWCVSTAAHCSIFVHGSANSAPKPALLYNGRIGLALGRFRDIQAMRVPGVSSVAPGRDLRAATALKPEIAKRAETRQNGRFVHFLPLTRSLPSRAGAAEIHLATRQREPSPCDLEPCGTALNRRTRSLVAKLGSVLFWAACHLRSRTSPEGLCSATCPYSSRLEIMATSSVLGHLHSRTTGSNEIMPNQLGRRASRFSVRRMQRYGTLDGIGS